MRSLEPDARLAFEAELARVGAPTSLYWSVAWARAFAEDGPYYAVTAATDGTAPRLGFAVHRAQSRALPGHWLWRLRQLDAELDPALLTAVAERLRRDAKENGRVLRLSVDLFTRDDAARDAAGALLAHAGFHRAAATRDYGRTLVLDLPASLDDLWSSPGFATVRKKVRVVERSPLEVRVIDDEALVERMSELLGMSFARTGGPDLQYDFAAIMRVGRDTPSASRLVGLFRTDTTGPEALVAYAWGLRHFDYAVYDVGASSREHAVRKYPLAYTLLWDLIRWSHETGAGWFDFGGVTEGTLDGGDPLGGISDFKRSFSEEVATVRSEWTYEPHRFRALVARGVSGVAAALQRRRAAVRRGSPSVAAPPAPPTASPSNHAVEQAAGGAQP